MAYVLGELRKAYPRVQRHRSRRPQKRLCRRRAAASPGAPCRARLRSATCGEEELVRQVHTLFVRSEQQVVVYELQVQEEVEGVRQEVREIERGKQGEEKRSHEHGHVDGVKDS